MSKEKPPPPVLLARASVAASAVANTVVTGCTLRRMGAIAGSGTETESPEREWRPELLFPRTSRRRRCLGRTSRLDPPERHRRSTSLGRV